MEAPRCPRCGYDQSGAVGAWRGSCPLLGVCTECGYGFAWREVLNPAFSRSVRLFEHARTRLLVCYLVTVWKALRPWSFWRWVRMEHEFVRQRAAAAGIGGAALVYGVLATVMTAEALGWIAVMRGLRGRSTSWSTWEHYLRRSLSDSWLWPWADPDQTWYFSGWQGHFTGAWPGTVGLALVAALVPLSFRVLPATLRSARVKHEHLVRVGIYSLVGVPMAMFAVFWVGEILWIVDGWHSAHRSSMGRPLTEAQNWLGTWSQAITVVAVLAWLWAWWGFACAQYLKLPRAGAVSFAMVFVAALAVAVVGMLTPVIREWMVNGLLGE